MLPLRVGIIYFPFHTGCRFSIKALIPKNESQTVIPMGKRVA
jgi:hypothetical protein